MSETWQSVVKTKEIQTYIMMTLTWGRFSGRNRTYRKQEAEKDN